MSISLSKLTTSNAFSGEKKGGRMIDDTVIVKDKTFVFEFLNKKNNFYQNQKESK